MSRLPTTVLAALAAAVLIVGCTSETYQLMPTPVLYQDPSAIPAIFQPKEARGSSTDVDLLNLVLFSPDIDIDVAKKNITYGISDPDMFTAWSHKRLPRSLGGRLTIYSSPQDQALLVSRILFRSRSRAGNMRAEDDPMDLQRYLAPLDKVDIIAYEGQRTDAYGHFYFTTNPRVSSDVIQLLRYGKKASDPSRALIKVAPIVWTFPRTEK